MRYLGWLVFFTQIGVIILCVSMWNFYTPNIRTTYIVWSLFSVGIMLNYLTKVIAHHTTQKMITENQEKLLKVFQSEVIHEILKLKGAIREIGEQIKPGSSILRKETVESSKYHSIAESSDELNQRLEDVRSRRPSGPQ